MPNEERDTEEEISTEPGLAQAGDGRSQSPRGSSSSRSPSRALLFLKAAHVVGAVALTGVNIPFAQRMYQHGDWKPLVGVAVAVVLIATRAGFADVWSAARSLIPWGKGSK